MKKIIDIPEIKTRIDLLYLQLQSIEKTIQNKQLEANKMFGLTPEKFKSEITTFTASINYFCDVEFLNFINTTKSTIRKVKKLIQ